MHFWEEARVEKRERAVSRMMEGFSNIVKKRGVKNQPAVSQSRVFNELNAKS